MSEYERHLPFNESGHMLPRVERSWTIGTVLASIGSLATIIVVVVGMIWGYAGVTFATNSIPDLKSTQGDLKQRVAVLEANAKNGDEKQNEILQQLYRLNDKVDRLSESKADKQMKGWTR